MELDSYLKFEIGAEAFRIMTGHMAPGKDAAAESYPAPYEERTVRYTEWAYANGECVRAMLLAFQRVMPDIAREIEKDCWGEESAAVGLSELHELLSAGFLGTSDPEFRAFVESMPDSHWAKYDLSAVRLGWEAHKRLGR